MKYLAISIFFSWLVFLDTCVGQVELQPWIEYLAPPGQKQVGRRVTGITPVINFPFRVAVEEVRDGRWPLASELTKFYRLQTATDAAVQWMLWGRDVQVADLNNDGFSDLVCSYTYMPTLGSYIDSAVIYWGNASGIDTTNYLRLATGYLPTYVYPQLGPPQIVDVNNDGLPDLIYPSDGINYHGRIFIWLSPITRSQPDTIIDGDSTDYELGMYGIAVGDLNGDGFPDIAMRGYGKAVMADDQYTYLRILWGTANRLQFIRGPRKRTAGPGLGFGLAIFDVNGDNRPDLIWGFRDQTRHDLIYVHYGGPQFDTIPSLTIHDPLEIGDFGLIIIDAGDMNGDGYHDIVVAGGHEDLGGYSYVLVYAGGPKIDTILDAGVGHCCEYGFGGSVASVGDINGDGLSDIVIGGSYAVSLRSNGYWGIFKGDSSIRVTDVKDIQSRPLGFQLDDAYPNPFNSSTIIRYSLPSKMRITLKVFDLLGREVATLVDENKNAGQYETTFDATPCSTGVYFYRLQSDKFSQTKKMILLR